MKSIWNNWLRDAVFLYSALYTVATIMNSVLYLANGQYEDPNGNWHELDRAILVFIMVLAYTLIRNLKLKNYWEPLAASAYRDIFLNYTIGYTAACVTGGVGALIQRKKKESSKSF